MVGKMIWIFSYLVKKSLIHLYFFQTEDGHPRKAQTDQALYSVHTHGCVACPMHQAACYWHYCVLHCTGAPGYSAAAAKLFSYFYVYQMSWKILSNNGIWFPVKSCHLAYVSNQIKWTIKIQAPFESHYLHIFKGFFGIPNFAVQIGCRE